MSEDRDEVVSRQTSATGVSIHERRLTARVITTQVAIQVFFGRVTLTLARDVVGIEDTYEDQTAALSPEQAEHLAGLLTAAAAKARSPEP